MKKYAFDDVVVLVDGERIASVHQRGREITRLPSPAQGKVLALLLERAARNAPGMSPEEVLTQLRMSTEKAKALAVATTKLRDWAGEELGIAAFVREKRLELLREVKHIAPMPPGAGHVPPLPELKLVGRDDQLNVLKDKLLPKRSDEPVHAVSALHGLAGVGKSALVLSFAHDPDVWSRYSDGILWCTLGLKPDRELLLSDWATALNVADVLKAPDADRIAQRLRAAIGGKKVLIIVDDVWERDDARWLHGIRPSGGGLLFTTRGTELAHELAPGHPPHVLSPLNEEDSLALMQHVAPSAGRDHRALLVDVARAVGHLPLALIVAARGIDLDLKAGYPVDGWLDFSRRLDEVAPLDMTGGGGVSLERLLARSTERLKPEEVARFALLSKLPPGPATFQAAQCAALWGAEDPTVSLRLLHHHGLLEGLGQEGYRLHPVLHAHAKLLLTQGTT